MKGDETVAKEGEDDIPSPEAVEGELPFDTGRERSQRCCRRSSGSATALIVAIDVRAFR